MAFVVQTPKALKNVEGFHNILTFHFLSIFSATASPQRSGDFSGQTAGDTEGMLGGSWWFCLPFGKHSSYSTLALQCVCLLWNRWELLGCLKLWACDFQTSLRQMNQTRFYIEESRNREAQVNLLLGGFPTQLEKEEYTNLLSEHLSVKSESVCVHMMCKLKI